jgi:hypothetical protein
MPTNTYVELKKEVVTGSPVTSVTFDLAGVSGYTDLVLVTSLKITSGGATNNRLSFNNDTGANYSNTILYGTGTTAGSYRSSNLTGGSIIDDVTSTEFSATIHHIMNYANTTTYKTTVGRSSPVGSSVQSNVGMWRNTNAITSITLTAGSSTFVVGSTLSLYGIKAVQVYTPSTIPASLNIGDQIRVPYTGSATTLSIPAGVNTMRLELAGACGGGDESNPIGPWGGYVAGDYTIGGSALTMYAYIGGKGAPRTDSNISGGFNGGGSAFGSPNGNIGYCQGSGGGGTDIRVGGTALANRIFVAGGGGGGTGSSYQGGAFGGYPDGAKGGPTTANGAPNSFSGAGGLGGTQSAGGAGGLGATDGSPAGQAGSLGTGGNGAQGTYGQGGGGGGGYYGGGGGGGANNGSGSSGGAGSSFLGSLTNTTFINGSNNNHGYAILTKVS